jgi:hypothetical protein
LSKTSHAFAPRYHWWPHHRLVPALPKIVSPADGRIGSRSRRRKVLRRDSFDRV